MTFSKTSVVALAMIMVVSVFALAPQANAADMFGDGWDDYASYGGTSSWDDYGSYGGSSGWDDYASYGGSPSWDDYGVYGGSSSWDDYGVYGGEEDYYEDEYYYEDDYGYGGSFGGGSVGCYWCGGGTTFKPAPVTPVSVSNPKYPSVPVSSGSQNQTQSQVSNNTNNNTNVNVNNNTAVAVAQVQIGSQQTPSYPSYPNYPTYPAPYCTIYQAQYGSYGYNSNQVYLSWTSSNASSAYLSGYGSVSVNGSKTVYSSYAQTFTLTVYGYNGQQATCQTTVNHYVAPTTPYVSLTQIPYTGFDFGPFGNAMYWVGLAMIALGGAYLAVYRIPALAFSGSTQKRSFAPIVAPKAPILVEKEAAEAKVAPIVASLRKAGTTDAMAIVQSKGSMPKIIIERY